MEYSFREVRTDDAVYVADHIKADNLQELQALRGGNVYNELVASIRDSVVSGCCCIDGRPMALYGLTRRNIMDSKYCVWLILTDEAEKHKVFIGRQTKQVIQAIVRDFGVCGNTVNADNKSIIKWVKWLGGKLQGPFPYGIYGLPHYYFEFDQDILKEG